MTATVQVSQRAAATSSGARRIARSQAAISVSPSAAPTRLALRAATSGRKRSAARTQPTITSAPTSVPTRNDSPLARSDFAASASVGPMTRMTSARVSAASTTTSRPMKPSRGPGAAATRGACASAVVIHPSIRGDAPRPQKASARFPSYAQSLMSWETIRNLVRDEWLILSLLLAWSLAGLAVICERLYALWNLVPKSEAFKDRVVDAIEKGDLGKAAALSEMSQVPLADVFERGLQTYQKMPHKTTEAVGSQRSATVLSLKRYLWALGTVGSSAPFVGLFGTVVGILKAFQSMSVAGTGGFKVVSQGIAAALVATAAGLMVAIYAVIAYNYFVARINGISMQYRLYC